MTKGRSSVVWKRTWPEEEPDDFTAYDGRLMVGRVNPVLGGTFRWSMFARIGNRSGTDRGIVGDADDARRRVEESYRDFRMGAPRSE